MKYQDRDRISSGRTLGQCMLVNGLAMTSHSDVLNPLTFDLYPTQG